MKNYIINSFILQQKNTIDNIYEYIKSRYDKSVKLSNIKIQNILNNPKDIEALYL